MLFKLQPGRKPGLTNLLYGGNMSKIVIYTQSNCRQSEKAKQLIQSKNLSFTEKDITYDVLVKREMIERTGGRATTPQIFINSQHIGNYEDLAKSSISKVG